MWSIIRDFTNNSESSYIEVWCTDQISEPPEIEDRNINLFTS